MGITKTELYTAQQNRIAILAKAIGHPARVAILQHLLKMQSCVCGEIVDEVGLSQATISQHLKALKSVGLISGIIEGTKVCYCINMKAFNELNNIFSENFTNNNGIVNLECC